MTISPSEIETIQPHIDACSGKVLTLGCGLGYFAYMASLKENVSEVTIIERSPEVIKLFTEHILPQFENKDKIHIIQADAIEYISKLEDGKFDYCFADIWDGPAQIEVYLQVKLLGNKFKKMKISYWIEDAIVQALCIGASEMMSLLMGANISLNNVPKDNIVIYTVVAMLKKAKIKNASELRGFFKHEKFMSILSKIAYDSDC